MATEGAGRTGSSGAGSRLVQPGNGRAATSSALHYARVVTLYENLACADYSTKPLTYAAPDGLHRALVKGGPYR